MKVILFASPWFLKFVIKFQNNIDNIAFSDLWSIIFSINSMSMYVMFVNSTVQILYKFSIKLLFEFIRIQGL